MPAVSPRAPSLREARGEAKPRAPGSAGCARTLFLGQRADLLLHAVHEAPRVAARRPCRALRLAAVAPDQPRGLGAALAQLTLHAGARLLDLTHRAVAGGVAPALELAQRPVELALRAAATADVRLGGLDDLVASGQRGADRDQYGTLGLGLNDLQGAELRLGARLGSLAGRLAAPGGVAPTSGGGLARRCLPLGLGLGSHVLTSPSRGGGTYSGSLLDLTSVVIYHRTPVRKPRLPAGYRTGSRRFVRIRSSQSCGRSSSRGEGSASGDAQTWFSPSIPSCAATASQKPRPRSYWRSFSSSPSKRCRMRSGAERLRRRRSIAARRPS